MDASVFGMAGLIGCGVVLCAGVAVPRNTAATCPKISFLLPSTVDGGNSLIIVGTTDTIVTTAGALHERAGAAYNAGCQYPVLVYCPYPALHRGGPSER